MHRLRGESDVPDHWDACRHDTRDGLRDRLAALQLDGLNAAFLHQSARGPQRIVARDLVRHERQVTDQVGPFGTTGHACAVIDHVVQRHRQGVVMTLHDHAQRVAHENHVRTRHVDQACHGRVVGGDHHKPLVVGLLLPKVQHSGSFHDV